MTLYPDVQTKAQHEVDLLLNGSRLPTIEDRSSLPYVDALIKETLRWHVALPLGANFSLIAIHRYSELSVFQPFLAVQIRTTFTTVARDILSALGLIIFVGYLIPQGSLILPNVRCVILFNVPTSRSYVVQRNCPGRRLPGGLLT